MSSRFSPTTSAFIAVLSLALVLALACGACGNDGDDPIDAAIDADAAVADAAADANQRSACENLCDCAVQACGQDRTACMSECAGLPASARACRTTHCGYAQGGSASTHCPHVAGDPTNGGTPAACIFP